MAYSQTSFQLTHLLQRGFRRLKVARTSLATGGTTTTIVDTRLVDILGDSNEDDALNNWTVIITRDSAGAGADPEGKFNRVSDYDDGGTITVPDSLTTAVAAGDRYMYISPDFPLYDMLDVVNDALTSEQIGFVPVKDDTLTTAANQTEYTLPLTAKGNDLLDVLVQGITTDSNNNQWIPVPEFRIFPSAGGSTDTLVIPQYPSGKIIRLVHLGVHPPVNSYDDPINEYIPRPLAIASFVAHALEWYNSQASGKDDFWLRREDRAWNQLDIAKAAYPIILPQRRFPNFPSFGASTSEHEFKPIPLP